MSVKSSLSPVVGALAVAGALFAAPAAAQMAAPAPAGDTRAALVKDVTNLSDKFTGLARVMAGKYDWRPGQGVRSVSDVFNLIVTENKMLAGLLSGAAPARGGGMGGQQQEATRFEVKVRVTEKEVFRPGMSVTATIETRSRTNVLSVPFQSVTTRPPKRVNASPSRSLSCAGMPVAAANFWPSVSTS